MSRTYKYPEPHPSKETQLSGQLAAVLGWDSLLPAPCAGLSGWVEFAFRSFPGSQHSIIHLSNSCFLTACADKCLPTQEAKNTNNNNL